jgi:hypothetical protein
MARQQLQVFCRNQVGDAAPALFRIYRRKGTMVVEVISTFTELVADIFVAGSNKVPRVRKTITTTTTEEDIIK